MRSYLRLIILVLTALPLFMVTASASPADVAGSGGSIWGADYFPDVPLIASLRSLSPAM